jgi:hypothetical protein
MATAGHLMLYVKPSTNALSPHTTTDTKAIATIERRQVL